MIQKKYFDELKKHKLIKYKKKNPCYIKPSTKFLRKILKTKTTNLKLNYFWNQSFDKNRLKIFVFWCFQNYGQNKTVKVLEILKYLGFQYATKAGLSLSIDDLIIPPTKSKLLIDAELITRTAMIQYKNAQITNLERFQKIIETWHITSEKMKDDMIYYFKTTNIFNPLYMMAFSGARGNVSQVRQLVGMRGLMANPQGQILDFPIRSNFREGLTLTEYVISCYGARKGVVDTALRTANAGYLTRRLVDVAQHIIISNFDCGTNRGLIISEMKQGNKVLFSLRQRLLGRVLAKDVVSGNSVVARKNEEISDNLSEMIASFVKTVIIRSPLTCKTTQFICQRCYGWSLAEGKLVGVGETVGIIAAQSIGEPGTQLTMRTFHTGGVFAGELLDQLIAPFAAIVKYNIYIPGNMIRTPQGTIAFLTRIESQLIVQSCSNSNEKKSYTIPPYTILFIRNGETVEKNQLLAQLCTFSPSLKNTGNNLIEYKIYSDLEGEIKSTNLKLLKKITEMNDTMHRSLQWGYIWILSGKIYQLPFNSIDSLQIKSGLQKKSNFFPIQGDFLTKSSILSQILWINNIENIKFNYDKKIDLLLNTKQHSLTHSNEIQRDWLKNWGMFSEIYCFKNINKSIKKFNKQFELIFEPSLINVYAQNLLIFLTIDKIRYKKLGYFIIFKKTSNQISIKKLKFLKQSHERKTLLINYHFLQKNNDKYTAHLNKQNNENKVFISIPLEYNTHNQNTLINTPNFFYQKQSNMFFEWFSDEPFFVDSGLLNFSEIFLFKTKKRFKKERKKRQEERSYSSATFLQKQIITSKKTQQDFNHLFSYYLKFYFIQETCWFVYVFINKNQIKYLNSNYSFISFLFRPFIQCQKQELSQFQFLKNNKLLFCLSLLKKSILIKSLILITKKNQKRFAIKQNFKSFKKTFDIEKQLSNNKIFQKIDKYKSNKYIRFYLSNQENQTRKLKQTNKTEYKKHKNVERLGKLKICYFHKNLSVSVNKRKNPTKYISSNPLYFFYNIVKKKIENLLLKKKIYNKLQLRLFFINRHSFGYCNNLKTSFFMIISNNYLTKNLFFDFYEYLEKKKGFLKNRLNFEKFSNIFINLCNRQPTYQKNSLFFYKSLLKKFSYININTIYNKQLIYKKSYIKKNYDKSKEIINIKNLKKFYSSFTYYIIKNQFRFAPAFQAQSVNQLENIYKKEIKNISDFNIYTQKLLLIKQLQSTFLSCFGKKIKKNTAIFTATNLISLHADYANSVKKYNFQKLINKMQKSKEYFKNKKLSYIKNSSYLHFIFKQIMKFSSYLFTKKKQKYGFLFLDSKQKQTEKMKNSLNHGLITLISCKKYVPVLLIKYKKNQKKRNSTLFHNIALFKHILIRKQSKDGKKHVIYDKDYLINNQINNFILKMYIIKLNSFKNLIINYYFKLVSFKWLLIESKASLEKTKIFNPIFFKRLYFSKFINKNLILSDNNSNVSTERHYLDLIQKKKNKENKFTRYSSRPAPTTLKKSKEKLLLYSRFSLVSQQYIKASKKQLSILIFHPQQNIFSNTFKIVLKRDFCFFCNLNNLSLLQKYLLSVSLNGLIPPHTPSINNKKIKLKKTIKIVTFKNFLNLKKIQSNKKICSKKNYLQKINKYLFSLLQIFSHNKFELFKKNRQCELLQLNFKSNYGMLTLQKNKKEGSSFPRFQEHFFQSRHLFYLSKKSTKILTKIWQLFENKKEFLLTNQPGWVCKPIKNMQSYYLNVCSNTNVYFINILLDKKLKFSNFNYLHSFHTIKIDYRFCEKKLIWLNSTFVQMIDLIKNFSSVDYKDNPLSIFSLSFLYSKLNLVNSNKHFKLLKNQIENAKKSNCYYWIINKKARFIKMKKENIYSFKGTENSEKKVRSTTETDKIFCIIKVQDFIINNYQNLSYFSNTNTLFASKKKLFKVFEQKNNEINNKSFILKSKYNSITLNKQKTSKKLISKFPNLELTFEQHFSLPSNKLTNRSHNNNQRNLTLNHEKAGNLINRKFTQSTYISNIIKIKNIENNNQIWNPTRLKMITKTKKILKLQKPLRIYRSFLGFVIPIDFDFSFQSSQIAWNFFPNSNLSNLKFEKKLNSTEFLKYLILKNKILNQIELKRNENNFWLQPSINLALFTQMSNSLKMLLRQPCIDWSAIQLLNIGYKKNIFFAPTKTLLLLSTHNYLNSNHPIALTKLYSGLKGEILYSLKNKKPKFESSSLMTKHAQLTDRVLEGESSLKSESSLFLTTADQISLKFKNEIILNNELDFVKKLKVFQTQKHIRSLKIFQIKSVKQIILIFKVLQKIHNNCQFGTQSIKINLGLFLFQGDLLNTFFKNPDNQLRAYQKKTRTNIIKSIIVNHSGQVIHLNQYKLTLRKGQPIFFSPNCIFHSYNGDFIQQNKPVLSLPYQQLKTGDIVQGIPKIEQLFEARLTFAGKLEFDNLTNILEILFQTYQNQLQLKLAVRRSIELIQMIIINSIQRIYRSQGVNISDKHLEVIVKQMTKKVEIIDSAQSGFLIGEHFDLDVVELWNSKLPKMKHVKYKPLILGISKASLQTDSFLSAASFQYTTRILSQAAFFKKRDFLKGLKENIIVGNIIPAGTGYFGNIEELFKTN